MQISLALWALLPCVSVPSAQQVRETRQVDDLWERQTNHARLERIQDWDGDGAEDLLIGDYRYPDSQSLTLGRVQLVSGATLEVLWEDVGLALPFSPEGLGFNLAVLGDVDGDGFDDFVVGSGGGPARVYSGREPRLIYRAWDPEEESGFGNPVVGATGDVNGDGRNDLWINDQVGGIDVLAGGDFHRIYNIPTPPEAQYFGLDGVVLGDVDGDGAPDFAISAPAAPWSFNASEHCRPGKVHVYSGATGSHLRVIEGFEPCDFFGYRLARLDDLTGDGVSELAIAANEVFRNRGSLLVYDPRTGDHLYTTNMPGGRWGFGRDLQGVTDANGNGVSDLLITAFDLEGFGPEPPLDIGQGEVWLVEGATGEFLYGFHNPSSEPTYKPRFGYALAPFIDLEDDGFPDYLVGSPATTITPGFLERFDSAPVGVRSLGQPCGNAANPRPRIGVSGAATRGRSLPIHLTDVAEGQDAVLTVGLQRRRTLASPLPGQLPQGPFALCQSWIRADARYPARATSVRRGTNVATVEVPIGTDPALVGTTFLAQWVLGGRHGPGVSRALEITVQADSLRQP